MGIMIRTTAKKLRRVPALLVAGAPGDSPTIELHPHGQNGGSRVKTELIYRQPWPTKQAARTAIFEFIEAFYNRRRRHSTLGYLSPAEFEAIHRETMAA